MRTSGWIVSLMVVIAMGIIGCEKEKRARDTVSARNTRCTFHARRSRGAGDTRRAVSRDTVSARAAPAIPPAPATQAADAAAANSAVASTEAQKLLDQALAYIKDNKLELADKTLTQLEGMKASLPAAMQTKIADARSLLNTAKAANAVKIPALPGGK